MPLTGQLYKSNENSVSRRIEMASQPYSQGFLPEPKSSGCGVLNTICLAKMLKMMPACHRILRIATRVLVYSSIFVASALPRATAQGNVGIGTLSPDEKLDVAGAVRIGNTLTNNIGTIRFRDTIFEGNIDGTEEGWRDLSNLWRKGASHTIYYDPLHNAQYGATVAIGSNASPIDINSNSFSRFYVRSQRDSITGGGSVTGTVTRDHLGYGPLVSSGPPGVSPYYVS